MRGESPSGCDVLFKRKSGSAVNILFLTDNFPPETNAPASRTYEHTKRWAAKGHHVTVVTGAPNFPGGKVFAGYRNRLWQREEMDGVHVVRVWTYISANEGFLRRTLDYLSFMFSAVLAGAILRRPDVIVATSPQFFTACAGYLVSKIRRRPYVFELRDLWPDSILAVGAMRESALVRILRKLEYFLYRKAARIVSVTHSFKKVLTANGIPAEQITVVPNGADLDAYQPGERPQALAERLGLGGKFVAAYVGTVGMAHGLSTLLAAAERLRTRDDICIVVVGTGAEKERLAAEAARRNLINLLFVGGVDKMEVREYWRLCDVALVLLKDQPLFNHVIPSKMFEAMGTERAIILGVRGESKNILEEAKAGVAIQPEDVDSLVQTIVEMADNPALCREMGLSGRHFVEKNYNRDNLALEILGALEQVNLGWK